MDEARRFFGQPRGITADMLTLSPLPALEAQRLFVARFETIEAERALNISAAGRAS
jgi:hypothetical protein